MYLQPSVHFGNMVLDVRPRDAGKTTVVRHILLNNADMRIGCIVNDVASINIDAKLIRNDQSRSQNPASSPADITDTVELANGCACTSLLSLLDPSYDTWTAIFHFSTSLALHRL